MNLLAWDTLLFGIPIVMAVVMLVLGAAGFDTDHGTEADWHSPFGIGRVPLSILLASFAFTFGATGLALGFIGLHGIIAVPLAGGASIVLTRSITRFLARRLPTLETRALRRTDFIGSSGKTVFEVSEKSGYLMLKDHDGNLQQFKCRSQAANIPKGRDVEVVDYDATNDALIVAERE